MPSEGGLVFVSAAGAAVVFHDRLLLLGFALRLLATFYHVWWGSVFSCAPSRFTSLRDVSNAAAGGYDPGVLWLRVICCQRCGLWLGAVLELRPRSALLQRSVLGAGSPGQFEGGGAKYQSTERGRERHVAMPNSRGGIDPGGVWPRA